MDLFVTAAVILSFATLVTAHVALAAGLGARGPWWRAPLSLVVVPLAPYWGFQQKMRVRAVLWAIALTVYVATLILANTMK